MNIRKIMVILSIFLFSLIFFELILLNNIILMNLSDHEKILSSLFYIFETESMKMDCFLFNFEGLERSHLRGCFFKYLSNKISRRVSRKISSAMKNLIYFNEGFFFLFSIIFSTQIFQYLEIARV